jgi:hypothetical protein
MLYQIFEVALQATAELSIGPTITSRNLFLLSSILYNAQTYFLPRFTTFDNYPKISANDNSFIPIVYKQHIYTYCAEVALRSSFISFNESTAIQNFLQNSTLFQNKNYIRFKNMHKYTVLIDNGINTYLTLRNNDGSTSANVQLSSSDLPNGSAIITPDSAIDFSTYNDPLKWTPIESNFYLTPDWGNVSGFLESSKSEEYKTFVDRFLSQVNFEDEVRNTFEVSQQLDDKKMCIAEFWAGGKHTITPPGFWNLFLVAYFQKYVSNDFDKQAKYFIILNSALFQTSIFVWSIKRNKMQARPIQTIRYYFGNQTINYYFGDNISTSLWKPYQPDDFVTPPFPDFISGHSTFSSVGSRILGNLIGNNLLDLNLSVSGDFGQYMSPLFSNSNNVEDKIYLHCFTIFPQTSSVNTPTSYPTKAVQMTYRSWDDMAIEAGVSRIYGGIHYECSNYAGYLVGNKIANDMISLFS